MNSMNSKATSVNRKKRSNRPREQDDDFFELKNREIDDPMLLRDSIMEQLEVYFKMRMITFIPNQKQLFRQGIEAILQGEAGKVYAIPFCPGFGKSTLIRAILEVFSKEFAKQSPIAKKIGGIIVVVEKTSEGEDLENLCNQHMKNERIAHLVSSPNDYNLSSGKCINGSATTYGECLKKSCPDYERCPLLQSTMHLNETPILIMLHARYQKHMENMAPFTWWENDTGQMKRTLLLIDELPNLIKEYALDIPTLNQLETDVMKYRDSYHQVHRKQKADLAYYLDISLRRSLKLLARNLSKTTALYGIIAQTEMDTIGLNNEKVSILRKLLQQYLSTEDAPIIKLIDALLAANGAYYAIGNNISLVSPKLCQLHGKGQPATFIFTGTAILSPEIFNNPNIEMIADERLHSYENLTVHVQRGDTFSSAKSALERKSNQLATLAWLQYVLDEAKQTHAKILVVTYKQYAKEFWKHLSAYHDVLIPYIDANGNPQPMLAYYGGLNGSNLYRESTCVISLGLNRYESKDYICRALAVDFDDSCKQQFKTISSEQWQSLDSLPMVMDMQDITLSRDLVQLVFRSALRKHDETPVELWLLQPPNNVVVHLQNYFEKCDVIEHKILPESCSVAHTSNRIYSGEQSNSGKLLTWLQNWDGATTKTPNEIRAETGLTQGQFKAAKKQPVVKQYFHEHIHTKGSGKNTVYTKVSGMEAIA